MTKIKKRYQTITYCGIKGIRKDLKAGTFLVEKYIRGERYAATFSSAKDAADWKKNFHPSLSLGKVNDSKTKESMKKKLKEIESKKSKKTIQRINGNDLGYTFSDIWELYKERYLPRLEDSTKNKRLSNAFFYNELMDLKMINFNADVISNHLELKKSLSLSNPKSRRYNFNNNLKELKTILNWYRENYDEQFTNPILKRHKSEGFLRKVPKKKKKMKKNELLSFFLELEKDSLFWRDFAESQFYFAGRVQEVAGLLVSSVDLESRSLDIENVAVWGSDKQFLYLKDSPKNNEERAIYLNDRLLEIMERRVKDRPASGCKYCQKTGVKMDLVFHINGEPLSYREIQYRYNKALKKAGLADKYSSTHIMRHTMANMVRSQLGLESAQAVGGWKTRDLVENVYTETPTHMGATARVEIENFLKMKEETSLKNPEQSKTCSGLKLLKP